MPFGLIGSPAAYGGDGVAPSDAVLTLVEERRAWWEDARSVWTEPETSSPAGSLP